MAGAEESFSYGRGRRRHTVFYENARAGYARARLAARTGFAGVAVWAAGDEDPALWPALGSLESR